MGGFQSKGFTIIELLVVIAVLGVLAVFGVPSYQDYVKKQELIGAAQDVYNHVQYARSESIANGNDIFFSFRNTGGTGWCLGVSDTVACDCNTNLAACTVNGAQTRSVTGADYPNITLAAVFAGPTTTSSFRAPRMIANAGTVTIAYPGFANAEVRVSAIGRVRLCSDSLSEYSGC